MNVSSYVGVVYLLALVLLLVGIGAPEWIERRSVMGIPPTDEAVLTEKISLWQYCVEVGGTGVYNGFPLPQREECGLIDSDCRADSVTGSNRVLLDGSAPITDNCERFNAARGGAVAAVVMVLLGFCCNATHRPYMAVTSGLMAVVGSTVTLATMADEGGSGCKTTRGNGAFSGTRCSHEWSFDVYVAGYAVLVGALVLQMVCVRRIHNRASDY